jgi:hypothetical protein
VLPSFQEASGRPALGHTGVTTALHAPRAVRILNDVGRRQPTDERRRQAQLAHQNVSPGPTSSVGEASGWSALSHAACVLSLVMPLSADSLQAAFMIEGDCETLSLGRRSRTLRCLCTRWRCSGPVRRRTPRWPSAERSVLEPSITDRYWRSAGRPRSISLRNRSL